MRKDFSSQTVPLRQRKYGWRHLLRERSWTVLNIIVGVSMLANTSSLAFLAPKAAEAASIGSYDQCSNDDGDGYASGDTGCRWTFGNLQSNNSLYHEGDSTVQRLWLDGFVPGSAHSVTLQYGTTKQGKHAYDFLTTWDASENWITEADLCQDIDGCVTSDATENTLPIPSDPNGSGQFETGTRNFVMRGGDLDSATTPSLTGSYAADSETSTTVDFTVANSGDMCTTSRQGETTCGIALFFGAHIANTDEWFAFNGTSGATAIPGSPYHVALSAMDGSSIGNRDNQMQAGAIFQGNVIIEKQTVPDGSTQSFTFNSQEAALASSLTDGGQIVAALNQGAYSVTEAATSGWTLTSIVCNDTDSTGNIKTGVLSLNVAASETVKCVFTNTRDTGSLVLEKELTGGPNGYTGPFAIHYDCGTGFIGDANVSAGGSQTINGIPTGTSCTVSEPSLPTVPNYDFGNPSFSPSATVMIPTGNGSSVTVTTNNSLIRETGDLKIIKLDQDQQTMSGVDFMVGNTPYTTNASGEILVSDLPTGDYTVTETEPADYSFTSVAGLRCTNANPSTATVINDTTTTCTFTNTRNRGTIELQKVWSGLPGAVTLQIGSTLGDDDQASAYLLGTDGTTGQVSVDTGTYYMSEAGSLSDYSTSPLSCYNDANDNGINDNETTVIPGKDDSVNVGNGEHVICAYTNTRNTGSVTIYKIVRGGTAEPADWTFTLHGTNGLPDVKNIKSGVSVNVPTGFYTVSESGPAQYSFVRAFGNCSEDGLIYMDVSNDGATCYFENETYGIHGQKFNDVNANATWDAGEAALNGWTMFLDTNLNKALDTGEKSIVTQNHNNVDGWYWFDDLTAGTYQICEVQKTGWAQTYPVTASGCHTIDLPISYDYNREGPPTIKNSSCKLSLNQSFSVMSLENSIISEATCDFGNRLIPVTTITLDKTGPATATKGQTFTYGLTWTVSGNTAATNAIITDPLPANTTFVSADNGGTFAAGVVTWNLGTKAPGSTGTVNVTVLVNPSLTASTTLNNTGTFDTDQTPPVSDSVPTTVTVPLVLGVSAEADLTLTKSVDDKTAERGQTLTYTLVVTNTGDADATNVVVTDNLPDGFTFLAGGRTTRTWNIGTLAAGASKTLTYKVVVGDNVIAGQHINRAFVTADFFDPIVAEAIVTVKIPQVLGLATTGAGLMDYMTFILGLVLVAAGAISFRQLRRRGHATA